MAPSTSASSPEIYSRCRRSLPARRLNIVLAKVDFDLVPDLRNLLKDGTCLDVPTVKVHAAFRLNEAFGSHLLDPDLVVRGDDELGSRKPVLEEFTELLAVILVDGHHDVIKHREAEAVAKEALHQRQVQADSHAILVALAVVGAGRVHSLVVERNLQIELTLGRFELRLERLFVLPVDLAVEVTKITFDRVIQVTQTLIRNVTVGVVDALANLRCLLRPLFSPARLATGFEAVLGERQKTVCRPGSALVRLCFDGRREGFDLRCQRSRRCDPTLLKTSLMAKHLFHGFQAIWQTL